MTSTVTYADLLQTRFPTLDPQVDDLFLLEAHQVAGLLTRAPARELAAVLHAHERVRRFLVARHPAIDEPLDHLLAAHGPVSDEELDASERALLWEIADWIVYQRAPSLYAETSSFDPGLSAIADVTTLDGRVVIDAGAGTGDMAMAMARAARHVFAVEPVAALRSYMRRRLVELSLENVFVMDGFLHGIPLPTAVADILVTRQAIGWNLDEELREVDRVLKPGGVALHFLGMPHPAPSDDELHGPLTSDGYRPGTYTEGSTLLRKYWKRCGAEPSAG